jgi:hypothetical protein
MTNSLTTEASVIQNMHNSTNVNHSSSERIALGPLAIAIIGGVIAGLVLYGASKITDNALKSGELLRAMSYPAQSALEQKAREINRLTLRIRQEEGFSRGLTTGNSQLLRRELADKYREASKILTDDLDSIILNDPKMKSIAIDAASALLTRANSVERGGILPPGFEPESLRSSSTNNDSVAASLPKMSIVSGDSLAERRSEAIITELEKAGISQNSSDFKSAFIGVVKNLTNLETDEKKDILTTQGFSSKVLETQRLMNS